MTPGPTIIRECSACGKYIAQPTMRSGNTFGARFWTDGKRDSPMLPDQPLLVKCQHCGALDWIAELRQVGEVDPWGSETDDKNRFPDARPALTPALQDYADFLEGGVSDKQKERYIRLQAWWVGNDPRRESEKSAQLDSFEADNLRIFVSLLDESKDNDRVMKAEALRELGEFVGAEKLLSTDFEDGLLKAVSIIRSLNQKKVTAVAEIKFE